MIYAIVVAAGKGVRMQTPRRKQYLNIGSRPILFHTLQAFDQCPCVDRLIVVVPPEDLGHCRDHILRPAQLNTEVALIAGGARRQDSVRNGLGAISEKEGIVLIHDGVRPLVTRELIEDCIRGAEKWGACIPTVSATDTPKQVKDAVVVRTISRDHLQFAQTPQAFMLPLIRIAHHEADAKNWTVTDDAALVEQMGERVHVISGLRENIKITTPQDLELAEYYFSSRARNA